VERTEWQRAGDLKLDPVAVRIIEAGWQRAKEILK